MRGKFFSIHQFINIYSPPRIITLDKTIIRGGITLEAEAYKRNALNTHTKYTKYISFSKTTLLQREPFSHNVLYYQ